MKLFQSNKGLIEETPKEKREFTPNQFLIHFRCIRQKK